MKLPESGPPLFPLSEYGSSAEMKLTLFTLTAEERWFWVKRKIRHLTALTGTEPISATL